MTPHDKNMVRLITDTQHIRELRAVVIVYVGAEPVFEITSNTPDRCIWTRKDLKGKSRDVAQFFPPGCIPRIRQLLPQLWDPDCQVRFEYEARDE